MSERETELAARGAPLAATEAVAATPQPVARTRCTAQVVLDLLFILGILGLIY